MSPSGLELGGAADPGVYRPNPADGVVTFAIGSILEHEALAFVRAFPRRDVELVVGLTPTPWNQRGLESRENRDLALETLVRVLGADRGLNELPVCLPDALFATPTHLSA